mmetsp:Transcript_25855/g.48183  ORF Transcript_25855/g.48183 Transcript_25855/m.48183 type:complete len:246 (-) Transcript_25855:20-757(-)
MAVDSIGRALLHGKSKVLLGNGLLVTDALLLLARGFVRFGSQRCFLRGRRATSFVLGSEVEQNSCRCQFVRALLWNVVFLRRSSWFHGRGYSSLSSLRLHGSSRGNRRGKTCRCRCRHLKCWYRPPSRRSVQCHLHRRGTRGVKSPRGHGRGCWWASKSSDQCGWNPTPHDRRSSSCPSSVECVVPGSSGCLLRIVILHRNHGACIKEAKAYEYCSMSSYSDELSSVLVDKVCVFGSDTSSGSLK